ncbi:MAG: hypothetical protein QNL04_03635 [SAR324 cluster bacterium]|nr:hypothetical protein [SAR324 cluster bacterium]
MFYHVEIKTHQDQLIQVKNVSMGDIAKRHFYPFEMGEKINFYGHSISKKDTKFLRILASSERVDLSEQKLFAPTTDLKTLKVGLDHDPIWDDTVDFLATVQGFIARFTSRRAGLDDHSLLRTEAPSIWTRPKHTKSL